MLVHVAMEDSMANSNNLKPFEKGHQKIGGRQPGTPNKFSRDVRAAMLVAANKLGADNKGRGGLEGFFMRVGLKHPQTLAMQLGRIPVLPKEPKTLWDFRRLSDDELRQLELLMMKIEVRLPPNEDNAEDNLQLDSDPRHTCTLLELVERQIDETIDANAVIPLTNEGK